MTERVEVGGLKVAKVLYDLVANEIAPGTGVEADKFFAELGKIVDDLAPKNKALLKKRDELQARIDAWHRERKGQPIDMAAYKQFLREIGYLLPEGEDFQIGTENVDPEIATLAGPQLVVPVMNARYALNAANARWGSLYDALYGSDVIPETGGADKGKGYNPTRGAKVVEYVRNFLDESAPLVDGSYSEAAGFAVDGGKLSVTLKDGTVTALRNPTQFAGYLGDGEPSSVLLRNNGLHIEIQFDRTHMIGKDDAAGIKDVVIEAALTTIQDFEDSVAAVDADDKVLGYRNWLGLMKGTLTDTFKKGDQTVNRTLNPDREYTAADGGRAAACCSCATSDT